MFNSPVIPKPNQGLSLSLCFLSLYHFLSFPSAESPRIVPSPLSIEEVHSSGVFSQSHLQFALSSLRAELSQCHDANEELVREMESVRADLRAEVKRNEQLRKLLEQHNIAVPEVCTHACTDICTLLFHTISFLFSLPPFSLLLCLSLSIRVSLLPKRKRESVRRRRPSVGRTETPCLSLRSGRRYVCVYV